MHLTPVHKDMVIRAETGFQKTHTPSETHGAMHLRLVPQLRMDPHNLQADRTHTEVFAKGHTLINAAAIHQAELEAIRPDLHAGKPKCPPVISRARHGSSTESRRKRRY